jgi:hypothetical protein
MSTTLANVQPPTVVSAPVIPPTFTYQNVTYVFSFINISGGTTGGGLSLDAAKPPPPATVGSGSIVVLIVYLIPGSGGVGGGGTGVTIDAFDESTNQLINDNFVTVTPDGGETGSGNTWGWVDTNVDETIAAYQQVPTDSATFDKWVDIDPGAKPVPTGLNLSLKGGADGDFLAFYKNPPPVSPQKQACNDTVQGLQQRIRNHGPLYPIGQWTNVKNALAKCVSEGYVTSATADSLIAGYENIAKSTQ